MLKLGSWDPHHFQLSLSTIWLCQGFAGFTVLGLRSFSEDGKRAIQYAETHRLEHNRLWNAGSPGRGRAMTAEQEL
jgi:hypothetical protein